jgi:hypothetical protein
MLPEDPKLSGKSLKVRMDLKVTYPSIMGGAQFKDVTINPSHTAELKLATPGAGKRYQSWFWWGGLIGSLIAVFACWRLRSLAKGLIKHGNPFQILPIEEAKPSEDAPPAQK